MCARRTARLRCITVVTGKTIEAELQHNFSRASRPGTLTLDVFKAFEEAANVKQQACEFRTERVKRVMHPLPRRNHCVGKHTSSFASAAPAAGR